MRPRCDRGLHGLLPGWLLRRGRGHGDLDRVGLMDEPMRSDQVLLWITVAVVVMLAALWGTSWWAPFAAMGAIVVCVAILVWRGSAL